MGWASRNICFEPYVSVRQLRALQLIYLIVYEHYTSDFVLNILKNILKINYRRDFIIFEANKGPQTKICNGYGNPIYLFYSSDTKHFDVVYTKDFINASSFCQCKLPNSLSNF